MPLSLLALLTTAGPAFASSNYPTRIAAKYGLDEGTAPTCTVCHASPAGGAGNVTKRFGLTMMNEYGLTGGGSSELEALLDQNEADGRDSDGDGVADVAELRAGTNPSSGGTDVPDGPDGPNGPNGPDGPDGPDGPQVPHGCDAMRSTIASGPPASSHLASALGAGLAATLLVRRRRARGASVRT